VLPRTGHVAHLEGPDVVAAEIGVLLGNSRSGRPVDRGTDREGNALSVR
jgi:hypothetical protein